MGRRTVLLIVAALIAALGTGMVFLYVGARTAAREANQQPVQVLKAVAQINPGETMADAQAAGKVQLGTVPRAQQLAGAVNTTAGLADQVALSTIYPNEQIIRGKFGAAGRPGHPDHPGPGHRHLGEPLRHRPGRGLRQPGRRRSRSS